MGWKKEQAITEEMGLKPCSMNRCCNAVGFKKHHDRAKYLEKLVLEYEKIVPKPDQEDIMETKNINHNYD